MSLFDLLLLRADVGYSPYLADYTSPFHKKLTPFIFLRNS